METANTQATGQKTISVARIGPKNMACTGAGGQLTCNMSFNKWNPVVYNFNGGQISGTATPTAGNNLPAADF